MRMPNFKSVFEPYFNGFLKMKTTMGFLAINYVIVLKELDEICQKMRVVEAILTEEIYNEWRNSRLNDSVKYLRNKCSTLRQFAKYMCNSGIPCYVPRLPRYKASVFVPRIFSTEEISCIFSTVDNLRFKQFTSYGCLFSIPALLRVLYVTGMRISEALSLKNEDVNLENSIILIRVTKNREQRLIPITPSLEDILRQYLQHRNNMPIKNVRESGAPFFISHNGRPITKLTAWKWFKIVLKESGIKHAEKFNSARLHDLRHTFAVHSLIKMVRQGMDIYCALPILSTLLGHKKVTSTEYYVRLTEEMFPNINNDVSTMSSYVFPTLKKSDEKE